MAIRSHEPLRNPLSQHKASRHKAVLVLFRSASNIHIGRLSSARGPGEDGSTGPLRPADAGGPRVMAMLVPQAARWPELASQPEPGPDVRQESSVFPQLLEPDHSITQAGRLEKPKTESGGPVKFGAGQKETPVHGLSASQNDPVIKDSPTGENQVQEERTWKRLQAILHKHEERMESTERAAPEILPAGTPEMAASPVSFQKEEQAGEAEIAAQPEVISNNPAQPEQPGPVEEPKGRLRLFRSRPGR